MPLKKTITQHFNRAASTYDDYCTIQNEVCAKALNLLLGYRSHFSMIADLACGTGESTLQLTKAIDYSQCICLDNADKLLALAQYKLRHLKHIEWILSNFEKPPSNLPPLDLIFCNMGFQWSSDIHACLKDWKQRLAHHGMIVFTIPVMGNFPEIKQAYTLKLQPFNDVIHMLHNSQYRLISSQQHTLSKQFKNPMAVLKSIKGVGAHAYHSKINKYKGLKRLNFQDIFHDSNNTFLTYQIGIFLAMKIT